ncbi:MAG: M15 family metallopeptidase [Turicibacter sp.]
MKNLFRAFYYYEVDKLARYVSFSKLHPEINLGDIVWMVNSCLDYPYYMHLSEIKNTSTAPLLVNKYNKLPKDYIPEHLVQIPNTQLYATNETVQAFLKLVAAAKLENLNLFVISAYRSIDYQAQLYREYLQVDSPDSVDTYAARPTHSEHHTGCALDICVTDQELEVFEDTPESNWLNQHAYKYGFIIRYLKDTSSLTGYRYEPWHITYVGINVAYRMHLYQIKTLEEYCVKYVDHTPYA